MGQNVSKMMYVVSTWT